MAITKQLELIHTVSLFQIKRLSNEQRFALHSNCYHYTNPLQQNHPHVVVGINCQKSG